MITVSSSCERPRRGFALPLGHEQRLGLKHEHHPARHHHRQRARRRHDRSHLVGDIVAGPDVACVDAIDVEPAQPFVDELLELMGERGLLDLVVALQEIHRFDVAGRDPLADRGRGEESHAITS